MRTKRRARILGALVFTIAAGPGPNAAAELEVISQSAQLQVELDFGGQGTDLEQTFVPFTSFNEMVGVTASGGSLSGSANYSVAAGESTIAASGSVVLNATSVNRQADAFALFKIRFSVTNGPVDAAFSVNADRTSVNNGDVQFSLSTLGLPVTPDFSGLFDCGSFGACAPLAFDKQVSLQNGTYEITIVDAVAADSANQAIVSSDWTLVIGDAPNCDLTWVTAAAAGDMGESGNWSPARIPVDNGAGCDNLIFDRNNVYTVTFAAAAANSMTLRRDLVSFEGQTLALSGKGGVPAVLIDAGGRLFVDEGVINVGLGGDVVIGGDASGEETASLVVTSPGAGLFLGTGGETVVGRTAAGLLRAEGGGAFSGGDLRAGVGDLATISAIGAVGVNGATPSTLAFSSARFGDGDSALVLVSEGGLIGVTGDAFVGPAGDATIQVNGPGAGGGALSKVIVDGALAIGGSAANASFTALVAAAEGGVVEAASIAVGVDGGGDATLRLADSTDTPPAFNSEISTDGDVAVGGVGDGRIEISGAATLFVGELGQTSALTVGGAGGGTGFLSAAGTAGSPAAVTVRGNLAVGIAGPGAIEASNALIEAEGTVTIGPAPESQTSHLTQVSLSEKSALTFGGALEVNARGNGTFDALSLTNGARAEVGGNASIREGRILVRGFLAGAPPGATDAETASAFDVTGELDLGSPFTTVQSRARIENGARLSADSLLLENGDAALLSNTASRRATAIFETTAVIGSTLSGDPAGVLRLLSLSHFEAKQGMTVRRTGRVLIARGAQYAGPRPQVQAGGILRKIRGSGGKQATDPAYIEGGLILDAGATLQIDADAGEEPNLILDGDAELLGDIEITFPDEAGLAAGQTFNLLQITGTKSGDFGETRFPTRSGDFEGEFAFENGQFMLEVVNPGVFVAASDPADVNGDGTVDAVDVQLVINAALGNEIDFDFNADANSDGQVNAVDIQLVINAALGLS